MIHREDAEQRALIQWADMTPMPRWTTSSITENAMKIGEYLFAIPNGGARGRIEAARLQGLGVRSGVSDLFFSFPSPASAVSVKGTGRNKHGLYIEMKAPKPYGKAPSKNQAIFSQRMVDTGYEAVVCYGWDAARRAISSYLMADL